ncbi:MAG: prepilin-type N-terminal cleavage/methylation domain-containing protein, partial [Gammaproteobacteria bacterium]|nr:prepilin-type N-terminal cleavage/methylation domain-containing protein [Gammaproteobacteria bacterium]
MQRIHRASHRRAQRGLSLIELMVGVTIGVLCVLIILQILSVWEARKRTVTSGASAQMSGALAEFTLDRDLRLAGYGFGTATSEVMGCSVVAGNTLRS